MAIVIYTYSNPYKINKEPYWAMIKNSFHLCASQTLANGLCDSYSDFYKGKLVTFSFFIKHLYENWVSDETELNQKATIDNLIEYMDFDEIVSGVSKDDIVSSLKRNRNYVLESIRLMFELGMKPKNIKTDMLTYEQKCIVAIYEELLLTSNKHFVLNNAISREDIINI